MTLILRPYQEDTLKRARIAIRRIKEMLKKAGESRGPRLLIQCPTGGGKTIIATAIILAHLQAIPNPIARFMAHRDFLIDQTSQTFTAHKIDHSFIQAKKWMDNYARVHVCMIPTVSSRLSQYTAIQPTICIWDECHHIAATTWAKIMAAWPNAIHIGLSATPCRLDGKGLDAFFDDMILGPSVAELIELGALSDYRYFAPSSPDLSQVRVMAGEYVTNDLDAEMGKAAVIGNLVEEYAKKARWKKAVYFCTSIKNSIETAEAFGQQGFRFVHLDGSHSPWERQQAARALATGEIHGMTNVALFGEGFDLAAQAQMDVTIEVVGLAKPTKSLGLSRQMVGRVLRPKDEPGIILDHANHLKEHGLPDDHVEWSLKGAEMKVKTDTYECQNCGSQIAKQSLVCRHCGFEHDPVEKLKGNSNGGACEVEHRDGDLEEIDRAMNRRGKQPSQLEEFQCETIEELIDIYKRRGIPRAEELAAQMFTSRARINGGRGWAREQQLHFYKELMGEG